MVFSVTAVNYYFLQHSFKFVIFAIVWLFIFVKIMRLREICYNRTIQREHSP
jgi:hypothetical protein